MTFLAPAALWWLLALVAVVALFVFRRRAERVPVSTLPFFKLLHRHLAESPWLRRLKRLLAFLLAVGLVVAASLALAGPVARFGDELPPAVAIVVDRSASTAARRVEGPSAFDQARNAALAALDRLSPHLPVAIVAADDGVQVIATLGSDRHLVRERLVGLAPRPVPGRPEPALDLARHLLPPAGAIWWVSDRPAPVPVGASFTATVAGPNAGITACALRRRPQQRNTLEAFIELQTTEDVAARLEISQDGTLGTLRTLDLMAGRRERLLLPLAAGDGGELHLRLVVAGDVLAADNEVWLTVPARQAIDVLWISPEPDGFTALALGTGGDDLAVRQGAPADWPPERLPDVLVADRWLPPAAPACGLVALQPPPGQDLLPVDPLPALVVDPPRSFGDDHPVLFGVTSQRLALAQTRRLAGNGWLEPLWQGDAGPLLAAGLRRGRPVVVATFDPVRSPDLGLTVGWPLLLANAIYWCAPDEGLEGAVRPTGGLMAVSTPTVTWSQAGGDRERVVVAGGQLPLDRIGRWQAGDEAGATALLSAAETRLPTAETGAGPEPTVATAATDWPLVLVLVALGLVLADHWAGHRWGVF